MDPWDQAAYLEKAVAEVQTLIQKGISIREILDNPDLNLEVLRMCGLPASYLVPHREGHISETLGNPQATEELLEEMEKSIHQIEQFPYIGSEVGDLGLAEKGYRKRVIQNYLVLHLIDSKQKQIVIMRILYGARAHHNLL